MDTLPKFTEIASAQGVTYLLEDRHILVLLLAMILHELQFSYDIFRADITPSWPLPI